MSVSAGNQTCYRVCGMRIGSTVLFPELPTIPNSHNEFLPDIEFSIDAEDLLPSTGDVVMTIEEPDGAPWLTCTRTSEGYRFHFPDMADFLVDRLGQRVTCFALPETPPETIRHLFLDQVIPPLLNLRGREALHASAIQTPFGACAFIGQSGRGKSTLAAAFDLAGYPALCDDCLLLKTDCDQVLVEPAYSGLRLWGDSLGVLFGSEWPTLPVSHYTSKRRILTRHFDGEVAGFLPLRGVYTLVRSEQGETLTDPGIELLSIRDACMELINCAYRLDLADRAMILRQMRIMERVAIEVPVKRLQLPNDLASLAIVREKILRDLKGG